MKLVYIFSRHPWIFPLLIFLFLVIVGATMHPLWGDEAETALFGRSILHHGVPYGWDGTNLMGLNDAVVLNKQLINHSSPWGQYYLVAASFALFGESSFTARLPFILLAIFSFPILYALFSRLTDGKKALWTLYVLSVSIPFTLFAYQARYYSMLLFGGALFLLSCLSLQDDKVKWKLLCLVSIIFLLYSNYLVASAFITASIFTFVLHFFLIKKSWHFVGKFLIWAFILLVIGVGTFLPWYVLLKPLDTRGVLNIGNLISLDFFPTFLQGISYYSENNAFPVLFLIPLVVVGIQALRNKQQRGVLLVGFVLPIIFIFLMTVATFISGDTIVFVRSRYTMMIFPYAVFISVYILSILAKWNKYIGIVCLTVYVTTTLFALSLRSFPLGFFNEVTISYPLPDKEVADYLTNNAKQGDTAFVNMDRDHEPLEFLLQKKIKFIKRVTTNNVRIFPEARGVVPKYIYSYRKEPDWVIFYSKRGYDGTFLTADYRPLPPGIDLTNDYTQIVLPVFFSDMSRPEIYLHSFEEVIPSDNDQIFIYHKKSFGDTQDTSS